MKGYILLNKDKLIRTFKLSSIILATIFFIVELYNCYQDNCSPKTEQLYWLIMTLLVVPIFVTISDVFHGYFEYRSTNKFFDTTSVSGLLKIGFKKDWDDRDSKWLLSKLIAVGQFDKYEMICEIEQGRLRVIAKSTYDHLDKWENREIVSS